MLTNALMPDKLGGLERYVRELSDALIAAGFPVTVLTKQISRAQPFIERTENGLEIVRHRPPRRYNPAYVFLYPWYVGIAVAHELRKYRDAIIHSHYAVTAFPVTLMGRRFVNTFHSPIHKEILLEHGDRYWLPDFSKSLVTSAVRGVERRVVKAAERNIVLSEFTQAQLNQLSPIAAEKSTIVPGGVDAEFFCEGKPGGDDWSRLASPLIFTARRLVARTGVEELVQAMRLLLQTSPRARMAIAGDGVRRKSIEAAIRSMGLSQSVRLLGRVSDSELRGWYRAADLTVMPTQELEGFGLTTAESLCCGTPVLVTPVGANPELVRDLHPLLVAEGKGPEAMVSALRLLLQSPEVMMAVKTQARPYAMERWSWNVVADKYVETYSESVG
jgi:glycosyltransferase involved in cell wall biosynthesis